MNWNDKRFKTALVLLFLGITAAAVGLAFYTDDQSVDRTAYVDLQRVFAEHPARTAAEQTLNQKAAEYKQQIEKETDQLSGSEQKELLKKYQNELKELESELLAQVTEEVEQTIIKTAEEKKVKFVLEKDDILYGGYDLTDDVLAGLEESWQHQPQ